MTAVQLVHDSVSRKDLSSCNHVCDRYKMYLVDKMKEDQKSEKGWKRKGLEEELSVAKKRKE